MTDLVASLLGALVTDVATNFQSSVASTIGAVGSEFLGKVMKRRTEAVREIMISELKLGDRRLTDLEIEESAAIVYRYARTAEEGTARVNMRLLAAVFAGQVHSNSIASDEFLFYANLLATLKRDELILLGTLLRVSEGVGDQDQLTATAQLRALEALVPLHFDTEDDYFASAGALLRTGLVASILSGENFGGTGEIVYRPTSCLVGSIGWSQSKAC